MDNGSGTTLTHSAPIEIGEMTDSEKLEYVFQFCRKMEEIFTALGENPMASMMLGNIKFD